MGYLIILHYFTTSTYFNITNHIPANTSAKHLPLPVGRPGGVPWRLAGQRLASSMDHPIIPIWVSGCVTISITKWEGRGPRLPISRENRMIDIDRPCILWRTQFWDRFKPPTAHLGLTRNQAVSDSGTRRNSGAKRFTHIDYKLELLRCTLNAKFSLNTKPWVITLKMFASHCLHWECLWWGSITSLQSSQLNWSLVWLGYVGLSGPSGKSGTQANFRKTVDFWAVC